MTLESTNIQLYTGTQPALANNRHTQTKLGLAFSDMISGMIPIGIRAKGIWSREQRCQTGPNQRWCQNDRQRGHSVSKRNQNRVTLVLPGAEGVWTRATRRPLDSQCARLLGGGEGGCSMLACERECMYLHIH